MLLLKLLKKTIMFPLFLLFCLTGGTAHAVIFDGMTLEQNAYYSGNNAFSLNGEFRLFFNGNSARLLNLRGTLGTAYKQWNEHFEVETLVWSMDVTYTPLIGTKLSLGNQFVDYSPYVFHSEPRQDNFLQGLFLKIDESRQIKFQGFMAMHAANSIRIPLTYSLTNKIYSYDTSKNPSMNMAAIPGQFFNNVWQEHPALWTGAQVQYEPLALLHFQETYLHENYQMEYSASYYEYNNDVLESSALFKPVSRFDARLLGSVMSKNLRVNKAVWNQYGTGRHGTVLDYESKELSSAYEISANLRTAEEEAPAMSKLEIHFTWRNIDKDYRPIHMNNARFDEGRGEDELDDIFSGERGYLAGLKKPLSDFWGITFDKIQLKEGIIRDVLIDDTRNEWRFGIYGQNIFKIFRFNILYRSLIFDHTFFLNNKRQLQGFVGSIAGDFTSFFSTEVSFVQHRYWIADHDEWFVKLLFKF